jgi:hypothetical protein
MIYRTFISHAWAYRDTYWAIRQMLDSAVQNYAFAYRDYSIPDHDPLLDRKNNILGGPRLLAAAIRTRIEQSTVVIVPARMFIMESDWVQKEIRYAREMRKRVIAVRSRSTLRTPALLEQEADLTVDANYRSLRNALVA